MSLNLLGASLYLACGGAVFLLGALVALYGPGGPVSGRGISAAFSVIWEMFFPSLLLFALAFPVEKKMLRKYSRFALLLYSPYIFHLVLVLFLGLYGGDAAAWIPRGGGGEGVIGRSFAVVSTLTARLIVPVQPPDEEECAGFLTFGPKGSGRGACHGAVDPGGFSAMPMEGIITLSFSARTGRPVFSTRGDCSSAWYRSRPTRRRASPSPKGISSFFTLMV